MYTLKSAWQTSRPRFWLYLFGPYLIGATAAWPPTTSHRLIFSLLLGLFFLWPANLLIYGINDYFDYDTDRLNPKKQSYESLMSPAARPAYLKILAVSCLPFLFLLPVISPLAVISLAAFIILGVSYSAPPFRTKSIPVLDSLTNFLYIIPSLVAYFALGGHHLNWLVVLAAGLWAMAMHAYSAIPDIEADRAAGLATIATLLGQPGTIFFCLVLYLAATILAASTIGVWSIILILPYLALMFWTFTKKTPSGVFLVYQYFPALNLLTGLAIFILVACLTALPIDPHLHHQSIFYKPTLR